MPADDCHGCGICDRCDREIQFANDAYDEIKRLREAIDQAIRDLEGASKHNQESLFEARITLRAALNASPVPSVNQLRS